MLTQKSTRRSREYATSLLMIIRMRKQTSRCFPLLDNALHDSLLTAPVSLPSISMHVEIEHLNPLAKKCSKRTLSHGKTARFGDNVKPNPRTTNDTSKTSSETDTTPTLLFPPSSMTRLPKRMYTLDLGIHFSSRRERDSAPLQLPSAPSSSSPSPETPSAITQH